MELIKAYAHQVVSYHPAAMRDEMFAEIYDNLCEEFIDQREEQPGLTEAEFLNRNKVHPMKYATELAAEGTAYLVGPQFYFSFLSTLKIALTLVVAFHIVIGAVGALARGEVWASFWGSIMSIPSTLLWVSASVLGVFVALEKSGESASWLDKWDVSELEMADSHQSISRGEISFDLVFSSFALLWIFDIVQLPVLLRHDGEWIQDWSVNLPDWFWVIIVCLLVIDIVFAVYRLRRTLWTRTMRMVTIATQACWIVLLAYAASQPDLLSVEHEEHVHVGEALQLIQAVREMLLHLDAEPPRLHLASRRLVGGAIRVGRTHDADG